MVLNEIVTSAAGALWLKYIPSLPLLLFVLGLCLTYKRYVLAPRNTAPTVGVAPGFFGSLKAPYRWKSESQNLIREGMLEYGIFGKPFKISSPTRWMTFITNPDIIDELRKLSLPILSYRPAADELLRSDYTFFPGLMEGAWHIEAIRKNPQIFGNIAERTTVLSEIVDEVKLAWKENTNIVGRDVDVWTEVGFYHAMVKVIARTTSRVFVGQPLCRNEEYLDSCIKFATNIFTSATLLDMTPRIFQPFVARYLYGRDTALVNALKHVGPIFEERKRKLDPNGGIWESGARPNDAIQWILEAAPPDTTIRNLTLGLMFLNIASIHTTAITITHVFFDLAANPSYHAPLRNEMEDQLSGGWTPQALSNLKKTDSVLRESARMNGTNIGTILRKVITPHTFSDGTHVTKGSWVLAPAASMHRLDRVYSSPGVFHGFRAYDKMQAGSEAKKIQAASTLASNNHLSFGDGVSTCPGRFFATNELKVMLSHILCNYEFKFEDGTTVRPENSYAGIACFPDMRTKLLFRCRRNSDGLVV